MSKKYNFMKSINRDEAFEQLEADILSDTWEKKTKSQTSYDCFDNAHLLNSGEDGSYWPKLSSLLSQNNLKPTDVFNQVDYLNQVVLAYHWPNLMVNSKLPNFIIPEIIDNFDESNKPDFVVIVENDNVTVTLSSRVNAVLVGGGGNGIESETRTQLLEYLKHNEIPVYYIGDIDPIGLNFANNIHDKVINDDYLKLYPDTDTLLDWFYEFGQYDDVLEGQTFGIGDKHPVNKRHLDYPYWLNPKLQPYKRLFRNAHADGKMPFIEQEALIDIYVEQINELTKEYQSK